MFEVWIGWDSREAEVADVCKFSIERHASPGVAAVNYLKLPDLQAKGLYSRPIERRDGRLYDPISEAPMSTEFAISRFLTPLVASTRYAIFCDCDFLWRTDIVKLIDQLRPEHAVTCVKHQHNPKESEKMDGQLQLLYARKNWSSMMVFDTTHPANSKLTVELVNSVPGRDLHRFCWLEDYEIGGVDVTWNWLEGSSDPSVDPNVIHYTRGGPWFEDWGHVAHAGLWTAEFEAMQKAREAGTWPEPDNDSPAQLTL